MQKEELLKELTRDGYLKSENVKAAFSAIDRKDFVAPGFEAEAYLNVPLPIGFGQTISQPLTVVFMLELLDLKPGQKILEIGSGSGWQTAMLAYLVSKPRTDADFTQINAENNQEKSAGRVIAIERIPELLRMGERNVSKYNYVSKGTVKFVEGDGSNGYAADAPYDRIIGAASADKLPEAWREQLAVGGRIVTPIRQSVIAFDKLSEKEFKETEYPGFIFVPLVKG